MSHYMIPKEKLTAEEVYQIEASPSSKAEYRVCPECGVRYYTDNGDKRCNN